MAVARRATILPVQRCGRAPLFCLLYGEDFVVEAAAGLVALIAHAAHHDQRRIRWGRLAVDQPLGPGRRSPQTMQIAVSLVTWSASAMSAGIGRRDSHDSPGPTR